MCSDRHIHAFLVLLTILQPIIICPGCSVKEDRESCPCLLELYFQDDAFLNGGILVDLAGHSGKASGFTLKDTSRSAAWQALVPRGGIWTAVSAVEEASENDGAASVVASPETVVDAAVPDTRAVLPPDIWMEIRRGQGCPPLWMSCMEVSSENDRNSLSVMLHKSYCRLALQIRDVSGTPFPFRLEVRGNVCGYHIDGTPAVGEFVAPAEYLDSQVSAIVEAEVCLPRQVDDGLKLDIISEDDRCRTFAIGNYIAASGYDWTSEDLRDIALEIDYAGTAVTFRIGVWEKTEQFEVVI